MVAKKKLPTRYFVISEDDEISWNAKAETGEHFVTVTAAVKRAAELANAEPGKTFYVAESMSYAKAEVAKAATHKMKG